MLVLALLALWPAVTAAAQAPAPFDPTVPGSGRLAVGITEFNPNFMWPIRARELPPPFNRWRYEFQQLRPRMVRLVLDWPSLQPEAGVPANLDVPQTGCSRGTPPCLGWMGVREQLAAIAALQREQDVQVLTVVTGSPAWAASAPAGCERPTETSRSRPPREDAMVAYRQLIKDVAAAGAQAGADLRWWTPWNEPNHPYFISPQREVCEVTSPSLSIAPYLRLVGSLDQALEELAVELPGTRQRVIGELSSSAGGSGLQTSVPEFIAGLPQDVVCDSPVYLQHAYVGAVAVFDRARDALAAHGCEQTHAIWITETALGVATSGPAPPGEVLPQDTLSGCTRLQTWLQRWYDHPQVTVAFQYTFRQDPLFRTGLVRPELDRAYSTLAAWQWWGSRDPAGAAPAAEDTCRQEPPPLTPEERREQGRPR